MSQLNLLISFATYYVVHGDYYVPSINRRVLVMSVTNAMPTEFSYLQTKAKIYLSMGSAKYRKNDAFGLPSEELSEVQLALIHKGMVQLANCTGVSPESPLTGLGIQGFYLVMEVLHFRVVKQKVHSSPEESIIDEMTLQHSMKFMQTTLFNCVNTDEVQ